MLSSLFILLITAASLVLLAVALTWGARKVRSPHGKLRFGFLCVGWLFLLDITLVALGSLSTLTSLPTAGASAIVLGLQTIGTLALFSYIFQIRLRSAIFLFALSFAVSVVEFLIMFAAVRPFIIEAFIMPTQSMSPTILPVDRFIVNKLLSPRRLDLIAYRNHTPPSVYCKRVIGLPGERLRFQNGGLFVNERQVALPLTLAGHCTAAPPTTPPERVRYRDGETIILGPDDYFVIGDNVDVSVDSRLEGPTSRSSIVGVIDLIYWPLSKVRIVR